MTSPFRVFFRRQLDAADSRALDAAGLRYRVSTGAAVFVGGDGDLPEPINHAIYVRAESAEDAVERVRQALAPGGEPTVFEVEQTDIDLEPPDDEDSSPPEKGSGPKRFEVVVGEKLETADQVSLVLKPFVGNERWSERFHDCESTLPSLDSPQTSEFNGANIKALASRTFALVVDLYHVKDALIEEAPGGVTRERVEEAISADPDLSLLADLCNQRKHGVLTRVRSGDEPKVKPYEGVGVDATAWRCRIMVEHHGAERELFSIVHAALAAWRRLFRSWGIQP